MRFRNHAALPHFFLWTPGQEARFETDGGKSAQSACRLRIGIRILEQSPHWKCFDPMEWPAGCPANDADYLGVIHLRYWARRFPSLPRMAVHTEGG